MSMPLTGKSLRTARLSRSNDGRFLFVPLDHSVSSGPVSNVADFTRLIAAIVDGGADGIVVHKGRARMIPPQLLTRCALTIHLSASTDHARDIDAKVLVGEVEEAVRLGADAVSVHVNIGSDTEAAQLVDLGRVAASCDRWGVPLLAMMYPRGPHIGDPALPRLLSHVVNIAADLGVDLVKTPMADPPEQMADVVAASPLPIIVAGGEGQGSVADFGRAAIAAGCRGVAVGRRIFTSADPLQTVRALAAVVHSPATAGRSTSETTLAGVL